MKLWSDNIQKHIVPALLCVASLFCLALNCHADDIDPTDISYVSVNPYTNEVTVSWYKSESANIKFTRILYIYEKSTLVKGNGIVDIPGNDDKSFVFKTDTVTQFTFDANEKPITLAVDAYSENGSNSTSLREYHTTMIASAKTTSCPSKIKISWTGYYGYEIAVEKYEIIESSNGTETVVKECNANETTCMLDLNETKDRSFFVRATFTDCRGKKQTSTSCMCEVSQKAYKLPEYLEIEALDIEKQDITITCICDVSSDFRTYVLSKSIGNTGDFTEFDTITLSSESSGKLVYTDKNAFETIPDVSYQIAVYNNCDSLLLVSQAHPDLLQVSDYDDGKINVLRWGDHGENVLHYRIWRSINNGSEQIIATTNDVTYEDDISNIRDNCVSLCYRIETIYPEGVSSFMYRACIDKQYKLLIPNAINPYSDIDENRVFKPKYAFLAGDYKMEIFNRFGGCVFSSDDINVGWDGTIKGQIAPTGTYQYKIQVNLPNGEVILRHGVVNLFYKLTE